MNHVTRIVGFADVDYLRHNAGIAETHMEKVRGNRARQIPPFRTATRDEGFSKPRSTSVLACVSQISGKRGRLPYGFESPSHNIMPDERQDNRSLANTYVRSDRHVDLGKTTETDCKKWFPRSVITRTPVEEIIVFVRWTFKQITFCSMSESLRR